MNDTPGSPEYTPSYPFDDFDGNLSTFRESLESKGDEIYQSELSNIITREPDIEAMKQNLSRQNEVDELAGYILQKLYDSVTHVSAEQLFGDILRMSELAMDAIGDEPFYVYISDSDSDQCLKKSNMFLAIMTMTRNKRMLRNFRDFVCLDHPLYTGEIDKNVRHVMYLDDVTFSGSQIIKNIQYMNRTRIDFDVVNLHVVVPYINPSIMLKVRQSSGFVRYLEWYFTSTYPRSIDTVYHDVVSSMPLVTTRVIDEIFRKFIGKESFDRFLFYTDLKIADSASIYDRVLLGHRLYDKAGGKPEQMRSIVTNCDTVTNNWFGTGNICPYPVYKTKRWLKTMGLLFDDYESDDDL